MSTVIKVEELSKMYLLHHSQKEKYISLREVISQKAKHLLSSSAKEKNERQEIFWALKDVSFEVKQGDRIGILGKNGAGKSTLLKILSRITHPTTGKISLKGRVASLLEVGTGFHPELSGRENIYLNGSVLGMSKTEIKNKFDEIVEFAGIEKFLDTPVKRYSSGMYVRLAFAVAAHLEPEILIIDEVLAVGDAEFQKKCLGKMKSISNEGRTLLFVSHNMAAISSLCQSALMLDQGRVYDQGPVEKIISAYLFSSKNNNGISEDNSIVGGEKKLKIRRIEILNQDFKPTSELNNAEPAFIQITFEIIKEGKGYNVSMELSNSKYGVIFTTALKDIDTEKNDSNILTKGLHTFRIELPMNLLREGDYSVSAGSAIPKTEVLDTFKPETGFFIFDSISPVAKTAEGRNGAILPVINWVETKNEIIF